MADIELVIKIPESEIPKQQDIIEIPLHFIDGKVCEAGGYEFDVLPKGHGRIIAEPTEGDIAKTIGGQNDFAECIREAVKAVFDNAQTIIEADKAESEPWEKWLYPNQKENEKMKDNDEKLIFCKRCRELKPVKGSVWDFVYRGFLCDSCYKKLLNLFNKENK